MSTPTRGCASTSYVPNATTRTTQDPSPGTGSLHDVPVPPRLVDFLRVTYGVLSSRPAGSSSWCWSWSSRPARSSSSGRRSGRARRPRPVRRRRIAGRPARRHDGGPRGVAHTDGRPRLAPAVAVAGKVLFVGQLGKYLPGSIWPMVAQMELGRDYGVPRRRSATVFVLLTALNLASALGTACLLLPFADGHRRLAWWPAHAGLLVRVPSAGAQPDGQLPAQDHRR